MEDLKERHVVGDGNASTFKRKPKLTVKGLNKVPNSGF
jgi:hypothetical protein